MAAATPDASVATGVAGRTEPPPLATAKVTATPDTGLLLTSRTSTAGSTATALPAVADCPLPAPLIAICVGAPAVSATDAEVTEVSPALAKLSVRAPTVPVIDRFGEGRKAARRWC